MQSYFTSLLKTKLNLLSITGKKPHLDYKRERLTGKVLSVLFDKRTTSFEVSDFIKTSKKLRSNISEVQVRDIFQYNFIGLCIAHKKDPFVINTSFLIRNTFDRTPYELHANLFSPIIESIHVHSAVEKLFYITHSKYYYLRKKPMPLSTIYFDYVIDMFDHDILHEEDSNIKAIEKKSLTSKENLTASNKS
uniref:Ribosomal protein L19 n=1 Tax=Physarum polycephalum TaxID=5791 RepID=F2Y9U2_PHYPO|nr:ribosomal protein L19 [Physarum polycephalum]